MFVSIPGEHVAIMLDGERVQTHMAGPVDSVAIGKLADGRAEVRTLYRSGAVCVRIASLYVWEIAGLERDGFRAVVRNDVASVWVQA